MIMQNKRLTAIVLTVAFLLLIPLIAMKFTNEVSWTLFDFVIAAVLLFGTGFLCELILRKVKKPGTASPSVQHCWWHSCSFG